MPQTRSRTDNIRFLSSTTGEHILDTYLEYAEVGGEELGALLRLVFDDEGNIRDGLMEFRENPDVLGDLQTRPYDPDQGPGDNWQTVMGFQWVTEEANRAKDWAQKIDGKVEADPDPEVGYSAKHWARRLAIDWDNLGFYYLGASSTPPTKMLDGTQLRIGAFYFDSVQKRPYFWSGTAWGTTNVPAAAVSVTLDYEAGGGQTQFDLGTPDVHGVNYTLATVAPFEGLDVFKNGSRLVFDHDGGSDQYTVDYGANRVVLNQSCTAGDLVQIDVLVPPERLSLAIKRIHLLAEFTPDGVTTVWPLQRADIVTPITPTSAEEIEVFIDNVRQVPGSDYTVSGSDLTWTTAPRSYEEVWGLWNQPGGDAAGEYRLDRDPDPSLIGPLSTDGQAIIIADDTPTEVGRIVNGLDASSNQGMSIGLHTGGVYDPDKGAAIFSRAGTGIGGAQVNVPSLKSPANTVSEVLVDESGNLLTKEVQSDWSSGTITSAAQADLGTGTTAQPWVAITNLTYATPVATEVAGGSVSIYASLYLVNKTANRAGTVDIGFGLDGADPTTGFRTVTVPANFAGTQSVEMLYELSGDIVDGTVIGIYARIASGDNVAFGVDVDGTVSPGTLLAQYSDPVVTGLAANNWIARDTANGAVDLGTGTGVGAWQAITGLTISPQTSPLGGVLTAAIALYCVNKTATYGGSISIGFGIDAADPLDIHVESKSVPKGYSGYVDMDIRRVTTETALTGAETLQVYARINSGEHVSFGVDVRGDLHASSAVVDYSA